MPTASDLNNARYAATGHFAEMPVMDFVDIILAGGRRGDEAMYYLLQQRLGRQLRGRYEAFQRRILCDYDDVVDDFFLYLRDGKNGVCTPPYQSLRRILKKESFEAWILSTFRNYLALRSAAEKETTPLCDETLANIDTPTSPLTDERMLAMASTLIAYAHQTLSPRDRFIFLRTLLTLLNKQQAMPNDMVAAAIGMTDVSYRVAAHRIKRKLAVARAWLLQSSCPEGCALDDFHRQMAHRIYDHFDNLYKILSAYYTSTLDTLGVSAKVKQLREEYLANTGMMLHEATGAYSSGPSISAFWNLLANMVCAG